MGVRGLQTFIEDYSPPECFALVSIKQLVEEFRAETGELNPKIVFDGSSTMRFIYGDLDWVSGGQIKQFLKKIEDFVKAFTKLGVRPVFFFGGYGADFSSRKGWFMRCRDKLNKVNTVFHKLANDTLTSELEPFLFVMPTNIGFSHYFRQIEGCEVHKGLTDCDSEIAHYARENNCLAVFGQDSEFIIYKSVKYYLSAKHFNMARMETRIYNREHFADFLGIHSSQLPLFATLAGNNTVNYFKDLRHFHRSLCNIRGGKVRFEVLFPALSEYIKKLPRGRALFDVLPDIAQEVLQDSKKSPLLAMSIRNYIATPETFLPARISEHPEWNAILEVAEKLHRADINSAIILKIMLGDGFGSSAGFEDFRKNDLPPAMSMLRTMRKRFYGIILMEKPADVEPEIVEEWSVEGNSNIEKPFTVWPILPTDRHPGLLALWGDDRSQEMEMIRWRLFVHAVSPRLNPEEVMNLPEHLVIPVAALFYIEEQDFLKPWEIEALLAVAVTLPSESLDRLADLSSDPVNLRAIRVATIYTRTLCAVIRLITLCGYPLPASKAFAHAYFDGKLFQHIYKNATYGVSQEVLLEDQACHVQQFREAKQLLFKNSTSRKSFRDAHE
nr:PREDICTED: constitutive coactivator of peroxisome proliferator-activated receptor gamma-like [Bemisia tabaci]XP_018913352.1 PREDICTED: constitutive coactivator of peroxisome proliferator-activated receptor gamma-like [Bemisia tabaci]